MSQTNWEADKMLDVYIYDYLVKRNLQQSAKAFQAEGKVSSDPVAIDAPRGILFEWWSVFCDIFIARTNEKHSDVAASYIEGLDQLRSGILQLQKSFMQSPQAFPQLQLLTPQHQQLLLQAQQNLSSPSAGDVESRKLRMLLNNRNIVLGKDGQANSVGDVVQNVGSPMQAACPVLPRGDTDMLIKASKNQTGPVSSSSPANSSGAANTAGPSPSSAPSTPSTHTPGDVISISSLQHSGSSSPSNQLADIDRFDDGSSEDSVESCLSHKGFSFVEVASSRASTSKVVCCHFSSDGKLLATGGHDKKAVLWYTTNSLKAKTTLEEHSLLITDVRFSPSMPRLATSSFDKTVRVWDADNPGYSLRTFTGHSASVMSLDFHPNKEDLICSCDGDSEMRYWSINDGSCARVFKGGTTQMRFQPRLGRYLAAAAENIVSILDVETQACRHSLQGHTKAVHSVCWDPLGEFVASVSEDSVRVWTFGSGSEGELVHELSCYGNKFHSCVFHPTYPSILVIGCYQSLELWNMVENKVMTLPAHEGLIASLAVSNVTGLVASASHDNCVKLWE